MKSPATSGVVYKYRSCANYFNHGHRTRQLAKAEEERLMAALETVSAIPKDKDQSDGEKHIAVWWASHNRWYAGEVRKFSGGKHTVYYDDGTQATHVLKNETVYVVFRAWCYFNCTDAFVQLLRKCQPVHWSVAILVNERGLLF